MSKYSIFSEKVREKLIAGFSDKLNDARCLIADPDKVLTAMSVENSLFGCVIDFARMRPKRNESFLIIGNIWTIVGIFFIQYNSDIENQLIELLDAIPLIFEDDHTLGRTVLKVSIVGIDRPDPIKYRDFSYYFIPFQIEIMTRATP